MGEGEIARRRRKKQGTKSYGLDSISRRALAFVTHTLLTETRQSLSCHISTMNRGRRTTSKQGKVGSSGRGEDDAAKRGGKLALTGKVVYLDLKDSRQVSAMATKLRKLGAVIETFLSKDVNYVISASAPSRSSSQTRGPEDAFGPDSPSFANTPSPFSSVPSPTLKNHDGKIVPVTRGQAMAQIARSRNRSPSPSSAVASAEKLGIKIISIEGAEKWLSKELQKLGQGAAAESRESQVPSKKRKGAFVKCKKFQQPYIKVESTTGGYRPFFSELSSWPHVNVETPAATCPFDGKGVAAVQRSGRHGDRDGLASMGHGHTPLSQSASHSQRRSLEAEDSSRLVGVPILTAGDLRRQREKRKKEQRRRGYCECCCVKYNDIDKHIAEQSHREFARDKSNYDNLDDLMRGCPSTGHFLKAIILQHCALQACSKPASSIRAEDNEVTTPDLVTDLEPQGHPAPGALGSGTAACGALSADGTAGRPGHVTPTHTPQYPPTTLSPAPSKRAHLASAPDPRDRWPDLQDSEDHPDPCVKVALNCSLGSNADAQDSATTTTTTAGTTLLPAVVIRRPGVKGVYGSPRRKWGQGHGSGLGPRECERTPKKVRERSLVFGDASIGSLLPVMEHPTPDAGAGEGRQSSLMTPTPGGDGRQSSLMTPTPGGEGRQSSLMTPTPGGEGRQSSLMTPTPGGEGRQSSLTTPTLGGEGRKRAHQLSGSSAQPSALCYKTEERERKRSRQLSGSSAHPGAANGACMEETVSDDQVMTIPWTMSSPNKVSSLSRTASTVSSPKKVASRTSQGASADSKTLRASVERRATSQKSEKGGQNDGHFENDPSDRNSDRAGTDGNAPSDWAERSVSSQAHHKAIIDTKAQNAPAHGNRCEGSNKQKQSKEGSGAWVKVKDSQPRTSNADVSRKPSTDTDKTDESTPNSSREEREERSRRKESRKTGSGTKNIRAERDQKSQKGSDRTGSNSIRAEREERTGSNSIRAERDERTGSNSIRAERDKRTGSNSIRAERDKKSSQKGSKGSGSNSIRSERDETSQKGSDRTGSNSSVSSNNSSTSEGQRRDSDKSGSGFNSSAGEKVKQRDRNKHTSSSSSNSGRDRDKHASSSISNSSKSEESSKRRDSGMNRSASQSISIEKVDSTRKDSEQIGSCSNSNRTEKADRSKQRDEDKTGSTSQSNRREQVERSKQRDLHGNSTNLHNSGRAKEETRQQRRLDQNDKEIKQQRRLDQNDEEIKQQRRLDQNDEETKQQRRLDQNDEEIKQQRRLDQNELTLPSSTGSQQEKRGPTSHSSRRKSKEAKNQNRAAETPCRTKKEGRSDHGDSDKNWETLNSIKTPKEGTRKPKDLDNRVSTPDSSRTGSKEKDERRDSVKRVSTSGSSRTESKEKDERSNSVKRVSTSDSSRTESKEKDERSNSVKRVSTSDSSRTESKEKDGKRDSVKRVSTPDSSRTESKEKDERRDSVKRVSTSGSSRTESKEKDERSNSVKRVSTSDSSRTESKEKDERSNSVKRVSTSDSSRTESKEKDGKRDSVKRVSTPDSSRTESKEKDEQRDSVKRVSTSGSSRTESKEKDERRDSVKRVSTPDSSRTESKDRYGKRDSVKRVSTSDSSARETDQGTVSSRQSDKRSEKGGKVKGHDEDGQQHIAANKTLTRPEMRISTAKRRIWDDEATASSQSRQSQPNSSPRKGEPLEHSPRLHSQSGNAVNPPLQASTPGGPRCSPRKRRVSGPLSGNGVSPPLQASTPGGPRCSPRKRPTSGPLSPTAVLRTPTKRLAQLDQEDNDLDDLGSSPVYLRAAVHSSTPVVVTTRKLRRVPTALAQDDRALRELLEPAPPSSAHRSRHSGLRQGGETSAATVPQKKGGNSDVREGRPSRRLSSRKDSRSTPTKPRAEHSTPTKPRAEHSTPTKPRAEHGTPTKSRVEHSTPTKGTPTKPRAEHGTPIQPSLRLKLVRRDSPRSGRKPATPPPSSPQSTKKVRLSRSWALLSNNSMSRLLHSEPEEASPFQGFHGNEEGLPSDMTFEYASEIEVTDNEDRQWFIEEERSEGWEAKDEERQGGAEVTGWAEGIPGGAMDRKLPGWAGDDDDDREESLQDDDDEKEESLQELIPTFSSPGKRSDSSWDDACDTYLALALQTRLPPAPPPRQRSPRKAAVPVARGNAKKRGRSESLVAEEDEDSNPSKKRRVSKKGASAQHATLTPTKRSSRETATSGAAQHGTLTPTKRSSRRGEGRGGEGPSGVDEDVLFNHSSPHKDRAAFSPLRVLNANVAWGVTSPLSPRTRSRSHHSPKITPPSFSLP